MSRVESSRLPVPTNKEETEIAIRSIDRIVVFLAHSKDPSKNERLVSV